MSASSRFQAHGRYISKGPFVLQLQSLFGGMKAICDEVVKNRNIFSIVNAFIFYF